MAANRAENSHNCRPLKTYAIPGKDIAVISDASDEYLLSMATEDQISKMKEAGLHAYNHNVEI